MDREDWKVNVPEGVSGDVEIKRFTVEDTVRGHVQAIMTGRYVPPGTYTGLYRGKDLWMSDTPDEQRDHHEPVRQMRERGGRVLIMGLGLGMVVKQALALPNVEHVDVIEIDPDVIRLVGPTYAGERCTIHEGDAYNFAWPKGSHWSVLWADIWLDLSEENLPEMTRIARSYGRRVDWQGAWGKEYVLYRRARGRREMGWW